MNWKASPQLPEPSGDGSYVNWLFCLPWNSEESISRLHLFDHDWINVWPSLRNHLSCRWIKGSVKWLLNSARSKFRYQICSNNANPKCGKYCPLVPTKTAKCTSKNVCVEAREDDHKIALMLVYVSLANFTTKPRCQSTSQHILSPTKSQSSKNERNTHVHTACTC